MAPHHDPARGLAAFVLVPALLAGSAAPGRTRTTPLGSIDPGDPGPSAQEPDSSAVINWASASSKA